MNDNQYLSRIPKEDIPHLKAMSKNYELAYNDNEDWATNLGKYYVSIYGRPTEWDIYFGIGASIIHYFGKEQSQDK